MFVENMDHCQGNIYKQKHTDKLHTANVHAGEIWINLQ
jgi:hypothetical protein